MEQDVKDLEALRALALVTQIKAQTCIERFKHSSHSEFEEDRLTSSINELTGNYQKAVDGILFPEKKP